MGEVPIRQQRFCLTLQMHAYVVSVADHPKRPAKHHWLGQPLRDQLPNTTQAHQTVFGDGLVQAHIHSRWT